MEKLNAIYAVLTTKLLLESPKLKKPRLNNIVQFQIYDRRDEDVLKEYF